MPMKHELSQAEVEEVRAKADEEAEGAEMEEEDDDDMEDENELMSDPAFASLRGVIVPKPKSGSAPAPPTTTADEDSDSEDGAPEEMDYGAAPAGGDDEDEEDEDDEDDDELEAQASDAFLLVANTDDDFSSLEVHCYNTVEGSLHVHHDVTLPSFPLTIAWMDYAGDAASGHLTSVSRGDGSYVGSFCAVGTFDPSIEIWNMDVLDPLEPTLVLKGNKQEKRGKKGKAGGAGGAPSGGAHPGHSDAVMGLSWNRAHRHMLASSSADKTVKLWDLDGGGKLLHTYRHHENKVQSVAWNPAEPTVLAAASYDRTASVTDARAAEAGRVARYALSGEPEALAWNVHNPAAFIVACDNGNLVSYDCRQPGKALWTVAAHGQPCTSFAQSALAPGLVATCSLDKTVKLWDMGSGGDTPVLVSSKAMGVGQVFTLSFFPDHPFLLAAGGGKGLVAVWDIAGDAGDVTEAAINTGGAATSVNVGADASLIAKRFDARIANPATVPGFGIRPRSDGQPVA